jgi:hypothetical protein
MKQSRAHQMGATLYKDQSQIWTISLPEGARRGQLTAAATRPAKSFTRLCWGLHPPLVFSDPRLGVRFGIERGDPGRMTVGDVDLDPE